MIDYKSYLFSSNDLSDPQVVTFAGGGVGLPLSLTVASTAAFPVGKLVWISGLGDADPGLNEKVQRFNGFAKVVEVFSATVIKVNKTVQYDIPTIYGSVYVVAPIEVFPTNLKECEKRKELQQNEFFYREKLSGTVKFVNRSIDGITDYSYLSAIEDGVNRCSLFLIDIYRKCQPGEDYELFFNGQFTLNDGSWDRDSCFYETEISPADIYSCLLENNEDVNILDVEDIIETTAPQEINLEFVTCAGYNEAGLTPDNVLCVGSVFFPVTFPDTGGHAQSGFSDPSCITPGEWQIYQNKYETIVSGGVGVFIAKITTTWVREVETTLNVGGVPNPPPGLGWYQITGTDIGGLPATKWGRPPYNLAYATYIWTLNCNDLTTWETVEFPTDPVVYNRNRWLFAALEYVARIQCGAVKGVVSDFFEWNPPGDTPGYVPGDNYVTGLANQYNLLTINQTSDIVTPTSSEAATKGMIKVKNFLDFIKEMFNVGWWITTDNYIRFEHVSVINKTPGLNFVTLDGGKWIKRNNKYKWKKDGMVSQETYYWSQAKYEDFVGRPIVYNADCLNKKANESEKRHDLTAVTTDIRFIQNNPLESIKTGFVIFANEEVSPGVYQIIKYTGVITQQLWNNSPLSWANLHDNLHRHYRIFITGKMNGFTQTFMSIQRFKLQNEFDYNTCCLEENIGEEIITQLGIGWLENLSLSLKSTQAKISLIFE